ncbi:MULTISPECIES: hypothetical protein [Bacillus cereus group]|uniref:hypothetical protein n=1 Tax=Bacillus cereus group TaxID=86661 RepID=UPI0021D029F3|nr:MULTISPECIES: hypothetical protein [Bacillus cereus group]MCU5224119.1 hypothetical protein [Bacillus tropicus]MCU5501868.1 hypothetical protein [Bacillus cereus]MDR5046779.1 hypothetical protein [Bacillus thuringiensis]
MELVKVYLDLNSQTANNLSSSMHLSADSHRNQLRREWHSPAPPTYVMGSTMPVGFSRSREANIQDRSVESSLNTINELLESLGDEANRTPNSTIPGLGTRYVDQKINETKEEYRIRKKKNSLWGNMQIEIGMVIVFIILMFLTKLAVTIYSALW